VQGPQEVSNKRCGTRGVKHGSNTKLQACSPTRYERVTSHTSDMRHSTLKSLDSRVSRVSREALESLSNSRVSLERLWRVSRVTL